MRAIGGALGTLRGEFWPVARKYNADCGRLFPRKVLLLLGDGAALTRGFSGYEEARSLPLPGPSFPPVKTPSACRTRQRAWLKRA
jgi:hypothetical protein